MGFLGDHRTRVSFPLPGVPGAKGIGYLVGPGLVLTRGRADPVSLPGSRIVDSPPVELWCDDDAGLMLLGVSDHPAPAELTRDLAVHAAGILARLDGDPEAAYTLHNVAVHLARTDCLAEAVDAQRHTVRLQRVVAGRDPDLYLPGLAEAVNNL